MRTLTDTEMTTVVGGDLENDLEVIGDFITKTCEENGEGTEVDLTLTKSSKGMDVKVGGFDIGGGGIKISFRCGPGGANSSDEGNDDEGEDEKAEESDK